MTSASTHPTDQPPASLAVHPGEVADSGAEPIDDLDALAEADPADAPVLADQITSVLADRLDAVGREQGAGD